MVFNIFRAVVWAVCNLFDMILIVWLINDAVPLIFLIFTSIFYKHFYLYKSKSVYLHDKTGASPILFSLFGYTYLNLVQE